MLNFLFLALILAGLFLLVVKLAKEREWKLPAGLAALGAGLLGWLTDLGDKIGAWF